MGLRINQNIAALNAYRNLTISEGQLARSLEKLSSGFRINRAADDAAGLVISENLRSQVRGLGVAVRNAQDGVSVVQTAEGALTEVTSILQRMRDLAVQAANQGASDATARAAAQAEIDELIAELDRIADTTRFGNTVLLDGTYGGTDTGAEISGTVAPSSYTWNADGVVLDITVDDGAGGFVSDSVTISVDSTDLADLLVDVQADIDASAIGAGRVVVSADAQNRVVLTSATTGTAGELFLVVTDASSVTGLANGSATGADATNGEFQVGANSGETISVSIDDMHSNALGDGVDFVDTLDVETDAAGAIDVLDAALSQVSEQRGALGAKQNRLEHTIANLSVARENLAASESRIRDTDMAAEIVEFTRAQILQQAGTAMLAQANALPQSVLQLLQ
jgi:flagellin